MDIKQKIAELSESWQKKKPTDKSRRSILGQLGKLVATGGAVALGASTTAHAHKAIDDGEEKEERFPGDPPEHFVVYQLNQAEHDYHEHVLGSVGAMIGKYEDNVDIVVACFGRGIHVVAKKPARPVHDSIIEKVKSLAGQGVKFHACNRTLTALNWTKDDILPFAKIVDVGAADMMELQEQNYTYITW